MNISRCLAALFFVVAAAYGSAWSQGQRAAPNERDEHRETMQLFQEIERRLTRIDLRLGDAADPASDDVEGFLRTIRSDGSFVLSSMDRLLEIQVHHTSGGG